MKHISRRNFIASSSIFAVSTIFLPASCKGMSDGPGDDGDGSSNPQTGQLTVDEHKILYADGRFNTFPSITRLSNGRTNLIFRQAPDWQDRYGVTEIDHDSSVMSLVANQGESLDAEIPTELYANFLHGIDRPAIITLRDGTLFCTYVLWQVDVKTPSNENTGIPVFDRWVGSIRSAFSMRSTNGGRTWDDPVALPGKQSIGQGSVELMDGSVLCGSYSDDIVVYRSTNKGLTWVTLATIQPPSGYILTEPVFYKTDTGKVVCYAKGVPDSGSGGQIRLITTESTDNGATWSPATLREATYIGAPHLLRLNDDAVLLTYKRSHTTAEIRGAVLNSECTDVDQVEHRILRGSLGVESGNTSAVMLDATRILIVYSNFDGTNGNRHIAGTFCRIG